MNGYEYTRQLKAKIAESLTHTLDLKNLARNPTGFRRWDEWLGVLHG